MGEGISRGSSGVVATVVTRGAHCYQIARDEDDNGSDGV
jgi:hypothetical protein